LNEALKIPRSMCGSVEARKSELRIHVSVVGRMGFEPATFRFLSIHHISFVPSPMRAKSNALYGHIVETMLSYRPMQPMH